jgi:hypothetical protein
MLERQWLDCKHQNLCSTLSPFGEMDFTVGDGPLCGLMTLPMFLF